MSPRIVDNRHPFSTMELDPPQEPASQHPPPPPKPGPPPTAAERGEAFIETLRTVGLMDDLGNGQLEALVERLPPTEDDDIRRVALMRLYYEDGAVGERRRKTDRLLIHDAQRPESARAVVARIAACTPEVGPLSLERIGTDDGPLVIRAGSETFSAVNESEEDLDTDQIDLSELDTAPTVAVRALFRAVNILLDQIQVRERYVLLCTDGQAECYVSLSLVDALALCGEGFLDDDDDDVVLEQGAWGRS